MRYLIAIFCPPLAILFCGRPFLALISGALWILSLVLVMFGVGILGLIGLTIHAWIVIGERSRNAQLDRLGDRIARRP